MEHFTIHLYLLSPADNYCTVFDCLASGASIEREGKQGEGSWKWRGDLIADATMERSQDMKKAPRKTYRDAFLVRAIAYFQTRFRMLLNVFSVKIFLTDF
jgi:uncharacterized protein YcnI